MTSAHAVPDPIDASPGPAEVHALDERERARLMAEMQSLIPTLRCRARKLIWRDDVEDLVQDTIERACRSLDKFTPGTNLRAWLFVIMVHRGRDLISREQRRRSRTSDVEVDHLEAPPPDPPGRAGFSRDEIVHALDSVREPFREALRMRLFENKSYAEIADLQKIPVATAGTRIKRARETLAGMLQRLRAQRDDGE